MREIKFRGKRKDNGKWVYGYLIEDCGKSYVCWALPNEMRDGYWQVISETVGQYTGLKDKNGEEIYEGDIVKVWDNYKQVYSSKNGGIDDIAIPTIQVVEFWEYGFFAGDFGVGKFEIEVIGNRFDNPELLEESR